VTIRHRAASEAEARALWAAVAADNPSYVTGAVSGEILEIHVAAANARSLRQTIDDLLAALGVAERAASASRGRYGTPAPGAGSVTAPR
jgi:Transcription factor Pcc1